MTLIKFTILMMSLAVCNDKEQANRNYISLEYSYDHTEIPLPTIIFYRDSFAVADEITFVGYRFKVSERELTLLENIIAKAASYLIIDSLASRYYDFTVVRNGKKAIYGTSTLRKSKEIFSSLLEQLRKHRDFTEMQNAFRYLNSQLRPAGA